MTWDTIVPIEDVQKAIVAFLKASVTLVARLQNAEQIKEYQYQGETFSYPAIRVQMGIPKPLDDINCGRWNMPFYILCFSEQKSSKECSQLATIVAKLFHTKQETLNGIRFVRFHVDSIIPPIRKDINSWRSEVDVHSMINLTI